MGSKKQSSKNQNVGVFIFIFVFLTINCTGKKDVVVKPLTADDVKRAPLENKQLEGEVSQNNKATSAGMATKEQKTDGTTEAKGIKQTGSRAWITGRVTETKENNDNKADEPQQVAKEGEDDLKKQVVAKKDEDEPKIAKKVDDWQFTPSLALSDGLGVVTQKGGVRRRTLQVDSLASSSIASASLGFSVGGAKSINSFRENIKNNFLPLLTDITYEGLFYDYFFDTSVKKPISCDKLFCPSYTTAISKDPFSKKSEYFLSVGLNSNIKKSDFSRKTLNLIIVLDISSSMSSPFNRYYYDQLSAVVHPRAPVHPGEQPKKPSFDEEKEWNKTKMQVAKESVVGLLKHLKPEDSLGVVLFDDQAYLAKPLRKVVETDMKAIEGHIMELESQGGTNMSAGLQRAGDLFKQLGFNNSDKVENRIIFLTDAQPNQGDLSEKGLAGLAKSLAQNQVYTTFIGVGVDFNTQLIESITKLRGANYYSVHSPKEFKDRMDKNFDYMVTPLVFNLKLQVETEGFEIQKVYGSPEANQVEGEIMTVNTLFPSESVEGKTRGGLVLLHLKKTGDKEENHIQLKVSYENRQGNKDTDTTEIEFEKQEDYYANTGVQKGILLVRYANLLRDWIVFERLDKTGWEVEDSGGQNSFVIQEWYKELGIPSNTDRHFGSSTRWERKSKPLVVSPEYKKIFTQFLLYLEQEIKAIGDQTIKQEAEILRTLIDLDR